MTDKIDMFELLDSWIEEFKQRMGDKDFCEAHHIDIWLEGKINSLESFKGEHLNYLIEKASMLAARVYGMFDSQLLVSAHLCNGDENIFKVAEKLHVNLSMYLFCLYLRWSLNKNTVELSKEEQETKGNKNEEKLH